MASLQAQIQKENDTLTVLPASQLQSNMNQSKESTTTWRKRKPLWELIDKLHACARAQFYYRSKVVGTVSWKNLMHFSTAEYYPRNESGESQGSTLQIRLPDSTIITFTLSSFYPRKHVDEEGQEIEHGGYTLYQTDHWDIQKTKRDSSMRYLQQLLMALSKEKDISQFQLTLDNQVESWKEHGPIRQKELKVTATFGVQNPESNCGSPVTKVCPFGDRTTTKLAIPFKPVGMIDWNERPYNSTHPQPGNVKGLLYIKYKCIEKFPVIEKVSLMYHHVTQ
eukprot:gnl/MRDRNA2_/MRDRNA2_52676_c0_seq1.p1 gnl/MRDRNA2_/MRDRNA2_52676_c0~~gnl/MRDRNA2_/MRDRNA2_52676_c0_seq1.p1  ORF type:complete len:322 (-),score=32.38 gnl/MRDRNA2_/MRDRNA2_52676_c0_seq1:557-1396(-)